MPLCLDKLEAVHKTGAKTIARCPACAEHGHDLSGDHLVIDAQGRFSCVVHSGPAGKEHRRRIFQLAGDRKPGVLIVRPADRNPPLKPIISDVLGRLGRVFSSLTYVGEVDDNKKESKEGVPNVPDHQSSPDPEIGVPSVPRVEIPAKRSRRFAATYAERIDAGFLSRWLQDVALPHSFALYPWAFVQDSGVFRSSLIADLSPAEPHARFRPALEEARRLRDLFAST